MNPSARQIGLIKALLLIISLIPALRLVWGAAEDTLGANPIETITRGLGDWTLNLLLLTLAITPLRRLSGWHWLTRLRRQFGLTAFAYACLHVTSYLWFDQFFDWAGIYKDIVKRPFITAGFFAFALLLPLAATSNNAMVRRLGGASWQQLHRLVYVIAILGVLHYTWMVKIDVAQPLVYALTLAVLLGARALWWLREQRRHATKPAQARPARRIIPIVPRR